ncbi:hypothetical protein ACQKJG_18060 [Priestia megaterium]|uniref:hypothetical protein n=1 Tax=Priestia megaterium TaxID=1404 RepID=UPI003D051D7F
MKPHFIECSTSSVKYRGEKVTNNPINLSLCTSIKKAQYSWYPDNEGIPCIKFNGCEEKWVYNNAAARDLDFKRISTNQFTANEE